MFPALRDLIGERWRTLLAYLFSMSESHFPEVFLGGRKIPVGIYMVETGSPPPWVLGLPHDGGVGARTVILQLDLFNYGSYFRMKNFQLPVEIYVLTKIPE